MAQLLTLYFWVIAETGNVTNGWLAHFPVILRLFIEFGGKLYLYLDAINDI